MVSRAVGPRDRKILEEARQVADAGDRWLVSAASGVQRAGTWARRELEIIGDSARAAWHTTVDVSRRLTPGHVPPGSRGPMGARPLAPTHRGFVGLDVLPATPAEVVSTRERAARPGAGRPEDGGGRSADGGPRLGLLLRLLSELVSEYGSRHYDAMQDDDRFWTLINLLQRANPRSRPRPRRGAGSTTGDTR